MLPVEYRLAVSASPGFGPWLLDAGVRLAVSTYQLGVLLVLSADPEGNLQLESYGFPRCMGLHWDGSSLWVAEERGVWRLAPEDAASDRLLRPAQRWPIGPVAPHDLAVDCAGLPLIAATAADFVGAVTGAGIVPRWRPESFDGSEGADCCHLNGLAVEHGELAYVSLCGHSKEQGGWRAQRVGGGRIVDVRSGRTVLHGLCMPHSPRLAADTLWFLESGTGLLRRWRKGESDASRVAFCPGFARGLALVGAMGSTAVVCLSKCRRERAFQGLPLERALAAYGVEAACGLSVIDTAAGAELHALRLEGVEELYDVVAMPLES